MVVHRTVQGKPATRRRPFLPIASWARALRRDIHAVAHAAQSPRTPWYAKALAVAVAGYALSPIDLIPDFIPVLGLLDDLIIVPLGLLLAVSLIPEDVMAECRAKASEAKPGPAGMVAAIVIIAIWAIAAVLLEWAFYAFWSRLS